MNSPRDHLSTLRWRAANGRTRVSNAWYRAAGRRISGARTRVSNARSRREIASGRRDAARRIGDEARSRLPVVRGRTNPATGLPHRRDAELGRGLDQALGRHRDALPVFARSSRPGRGR